MSNLPSGNGIIHVISAFAILQMYHQTHAAFKAHTLLQEISALHENVLLSESSL